MKRRAETRIGAESAGVEIVEWLTKRFTYADAARWGEFIGSCELVVNGKGTYPGYLLRKGDMVEFKPEGLREPPARLGFTVVFEDDDYLIIDKPAQLCCHPAGPFFENSLWGILKNSARAEFHFASRLDRETSGLLALCKSKEALRRWEDARSVGAIDKTYIAIVHGTFPSSIEAVGSLIPDAGSLVRKKRRFILETAREAAACGGERCSTSLRPLRHARGLSLVEATLRTGRTHQIRASLYSLGYPVLGDKLYGLDEGFFLRFSAGTLSADDVGRLVLDRQALHSMSLRFPSRDGSMLQCRAEPPPEFSAPMADPPP